MSKTRPVTKTSTGVVASGGCWLDGYLVNTSSTFRIYSSASTTHNDAADFPGTITPAAVGSYKLFGMYSSAGVYFQSGGESINITFLIRDID